MRTWALISVLAHAARLYSRFFPHAPSLPQLANKVAFLSQLNVSGTISSDRVISGWFGRSEKWPALAKRCCLLLRKKLHRFSR